MPQLNRRNFLQSLTAVGLVPAIPALPAAAQASAGHTSIQFVWASLYAQMNNACSVPQIVSALNVSPAVAESLMARLVDMRILTTPGVDGVARARRPVMQGLKSGGHPATTAPGVGSNAFDPAAIMKVITRNMARETASFARALA